MSKKHHTKAELDAMSVEQLKELEKQAEASMEKAFDENFQIPAYKAARHFVGRMVNIFAEGNEDPVEKRMDEALDAFCTALCSGWRMMLVSSVKDGTLDTILEGMGYVKKDEDDDGDADNADGDEAEGK